MFVVLFMFPLFVCMLLVFHGENYLHLYTIHAYQSYEKKDLSVCFKLFRCLTDCITMVVIQIYRIRIGLHYGRQLKIKGIDFLNLFEFLLVMSLLFIAGKERNPGPYLRIPTVQQYLVSSQIM